MRRLAPIHFSVRRLLLIALLLAFPASASAAGSGTGGATVTPPSFSISPGTVTAGAPVTVSVSVPGRAVVRLGSARLRVRGTTTRRWRPGVAPGVYRARLRMGGHTVRRFPVTVTAAVPAAASTGSGVFPVRGSGWSYGGPEDRFGAGRPGHSHQGQDVLAPEGTPLVSPVDGTVYFRRVQPASAGHYLVIRDADGTDYVLMHLVAGSERVERGDPVRAGQRIGDVGSTGDADGPLLHFEIWPDGWYAPGSQPVDPLPQLRAWAG